MKKVLGGCIASAMLLGQLIAQPEPTFNVTSIKASNSQFSSGLQIGPNRLTAGGVTLSQLIQYAYNVPAVRITGASIRLGLFDIEGKADGPHTRSELLQMLRGTLQERFKLALHRESQEMPIEALVVGKNGPKLQAATSVDIMPSISFGAGRSGGNASVLITGKNVSLSFVANYLSDRLHRPVVDKTNLEGSFDFAAEVVMDRDEAGDPKVSETDMMGHIVMDLVQRIGLKLEPQKALVEILVVDHAEKPDGN